LWAETRFIIIITPKEMQKILTFLCAIALFIAACSPKTSTTAAATNAKSKPQAAPKKLKWERDFLFQPVVLNVDTTTVVLADFYENANEIAEVACANNDPKITWSADKKTILVDAIAMQKAYATIVITKKDGTKQGIVLKKSAKILVSFLFNAAGKDITKVQLAGDMNNWQPAQTFLGRKGPKADVFKTTLMLNPGTYSYQYVVDDKWQLDPNNPKTKDNGNGGNNSLLEVKAPDYKTLPMVFVEKVGSKNLIVRGTGTSANVLVFWQNELITTSSLGSANSFSAAIELPAAAATMPRSWLRIYTYNDNGTGNDVLMPLQNGQPVLDAKNLTRQDKESQLMYFMLVDRFKDGDQTNNHPVDDKRVTALENFQGGDVKGITKKIKDGYFKSLNINTLWVSPLSQQPYDVWQEAPKPRRWYTGYHGYWPISSSKIDYRYGNDADLKELVKTAHANNMNVVMDYVAHHVHQLHPLYKTNPDQVTPFILPDGRKNLRIWDEQRLTTWFDDFLPTLNLTNDKVVQMQVDSAMYWIEKYNLDGFRHDATKHIPLGFWRTLQTQMKTRLGRPYYQIGETFGSRELIQSYIGSGTMDAQFDFNLYFDAREVFGKDDVSFQRLQNSLLETFSYYGSHSTMGNITGNHDLVRFMGLASKAVKWDEDGKEAGYARKIEVIDTTAFAKMSSLTAFLMTIPGVPIIYYGDEIGQVGAGDPDCRRMMRFEGWNALETRTKKRAEALTALRNSHLEMTYGEFIPLTVTDDTWVFARYYMGKISIVAFNKGNTEATITTELPDYLILNGLDAKFGSKYKTDGKKLTITVAPHAFEVITY
jgi:cyclomaltodextrinase / maltogenic alpha-amylase / neopullulanase